MYFMKEDKLITNDVAAVKVAVELCNLELKTEILSAPNDVNKSHNSDRIHQWTENLEKKAEILLKTTNLPKKMRKKVLGVVLPISIRMLTWAEYHEGTIGFKREYSIDFLNASLFTKWGIINDKKAAEALIHGNYLSIEQKYKLACIYFFTDHIPGLISQITLEEMKKFYNPDPQFIKQPMLVKFWTYFLKNEVDLIRGEKDLNQYILETAIECGSKEATEYCLENSMYYAIARVWLVDAALETVKNLILVRDDSIVFRVQRYDANNESWVPNHYYIDILCSLMSKMRRVELVKFLKKDIQGANYIEESVEYPTRSRVLEIFLSWPYQDNFMLTAEEMWEFLPRRNYAVLLLKICDKIEPNKATNFRYRDEKSYNYRGLLKKFWWQSPERYKKFVFSNEEVAYKTDRLVRVKAGVELLTKLLKLKKFCNDDKENIMLILSSTTYEEIANIVSSKEWESFCFGLMKEEKYELLDWIVQHCFKTKEQANVFRIGLIFTKDVQIFCIDLVKNKNYYTVESYIKWCSLSEDEINQFKKEVVNSEYSLQACLSLVQSEKLVDLDRFIRWHISSEDEEKIFKKQLIFSVGGVFKCADLVREDKLDLVNDFINVCLFSEKEVRELKKNVAYRTGSSVLEELISDYSEEYFYDEYSSDLTLCTNTFKGGKWEEVENFLTWCCLSEEEMGDFKKNVLYKKSGVQIHFNLIKSNQWEEANNFFAWLGLSAVEIKELKKDTLFDLEAAGEMFSELMYSKEGDQRFANYGSKQEAIELLLRWYLSDNETILEFKEKFTSENRDEHENNKAVLKNFDLAIARRLSDLEKEAMEVKRKSEAFYRNKRICNLEREVGASK